MTQNSFTCELPPDYVQALESMAADAELSVPQMLRMLIREAQALRHPAKFLPMLPLSENSPKQVIVLRKDLNMRKGKMVSQGAHASWAALLENASFDAGLQSVTFRLGEAEWNWLASGHFKKICVSVNSEEELFGIHRQAKLAGLPCKLIQDSGLTEFKEPTFTALAVGPGWPQEVDAITGGLPLL